MYLQFRGFSPEKVCRKKRARVNFPGDKKLNQTIRPVAYRPSRSGKRSSSPCSSLPSTKDDFPCCTRSALLSSQLNEDGRRNATRKVVLVPPSCVERGFFFCSAGKAGIAFIGVSRRSVGPRSSSCSFTVLLSPFLFMRRIPGGSFLT